MEKVFISNALLRKFEKHALSSAPNECVGVFECMFNGKIMEVTAIYECKNVAEDKRFGALLAKRDFRFFNKRRVALEKYHIFHGIYHSHPISGSLKLSAQDKWSARFYKLFNIQLILGIKRNSVKTMFWRKKLKIWRSSKLIKLGHDSN